MELPQDRSVLVAVTWGLARKLLFPSFPLNLSAELKEGGKAEERVEKKLHIYIYFKEIGWAGGECQGVKMLDRARSESWNKEASLC